MAAKLVRTGQVLIKHNGRDPKEAFENVIGQLLAEGHDREALGLCIGLALLWCERVEVLWEKAIAAHELI